MYTLPLSPIFYVSSVILALISKPTYLFSSLRLSNHVYTHIEYK
jgi:hypothetical protein